MNEAMLAHDALLIVSRFLTKCSVIFLCRRLFSINMKRRIFLCDVATGVSTLWCVAALLTLLVQCDLFQRIGYDGPHCHNTVRELLLFVFDTAKVDRCSDGKLAE